MTGNGPAGFDMSEVTRGDSAGRRRGFCGSSEAAGPCGWGTLERAQHQATPAGAAVAEAAGQAGRQLAAGGTDLAELLGRSGYEPRHGPGGSIHLANCPFHELAVRHAGLVCAMNLHLLRGLIEQLGSGAQARLDPAEGRCCVTITPVLSPSGGKRARPARGPWHPAAGR